MMKIAAALFALVAVNVEAFAPSSTHRVAQPAFVLEKPMSSTALEMGVLSRVFGRGKTAKSDITEEEVRSLFSLWNNALATGESKLVAKRYAKRQGCRPPPDGL